jgi:hypothetical protein
MMKALVGSMETGFHDAKRQSCTRRGFDRSSEVPTDFYYDCRIEIVVACVHTNLQGIVVCGV